ncbi:d67c9873-148d-4e96-a617-e37e28981b5f-CDS [Sclerotinia trifoliorum]|uniref:D67c9873-148d-4e96-a617-e37e28981b5f-CDS n=1 Tax=Sclerotinia trifoliorum TaxID=28548 RepID=A0A8H2VTK9_9HELO|nr:d67c9873-148d-4e96-a617-e37e28981b5f-CDS [Sclerotinia trifoliorum]
MSNKITNARIAELQRLMDRKDELRTTIQEKQDAMQRIVDTMNEEAQTLTSSSAKAVMAARGKVSSTLSYQDEVDSYEIAIARLEELYAEVEAELKGLQELMEPQDST